MVTYIKSLNSNPVKGAGMVEAILSSDCYHGLLAWVVPGKPGTGLLAQLLLEGVAMTVSMTCNIGLKPQRPMSPYGIILIWALNRVPTSSLYGPRIHPCTVFHSGPLMAKVAFCSCKQYKKACCRQALSYARTRATRWATSGLLAPSLL